ncbi:hypothetical protein FB567DRAFT_39948 [Paraphoma chrysanthemicola]|uniref:DUF7730 domain-containing protein n=1 Tax=Paraphoma chrysanthemicola TaxID=798071 RepID=A0A8K0RMB5_9PLEO|nr:hypothetical protein FB567DRAFT_39948 [Paraphoma chrysanthemicola]
MVCPTYLEVSDMTLSSIRKKKAVGATKNSSRKRKTSATSLGCTQTHVDTTSFPFLKLPGEVRNMIYSYLLVDYDHPLRFEARSRVQQGRCSVRRLYRARPGLPDRDDLPGQLKGSITKSLISYKSFDSFRKAQRQMTFGVRIFEACKQINQEAAPIFYGSNLFTFEAVPHLYTFLTHFQQRLPFIAKIGLATVSPHPDHYYGPKPFVHYTLASIFLPLSAAINLEALYLNVSILQNLSGCAPLAAQNLFWNASAWMYMLAVQKKNSLAVLDVLKLPPTRNMSSPKWAISKAGQDAFRTELAKKLTMV